MDGNPTLLGSAATGQTGTIVTSLPMLTGCGTVSYVGSLTLYGVRSPRNRAVIAVQFALPTVTASAQTV